MLAAAGFTAQEIVDGKGILSTFPEAKSLSIYRVGTYHTDS